MVSILYVGEDARTAQDHALALHAAGHSVDLQQNQITARARLDGPPADMVVIDAPHPDAGCGLLVHQAREAWADAWVIAMTRPGDVAGTMVDRMGLWDPHRTLTHPVAARQLVAAVNTLLAGNTMVGA